MSSKKIKSEIARLRQNYQEIEGKPFEHFYCPILFRDEKTELCEGHVINQAIHDSTRLWVVQRKDVDNFYGRVFESDAVAMVESHEMTFSDVLMDKNIQRKMERTITMDGETIPHYHQVGKCVPE